MLPCVLGSMKASVRNRCCGNDFALRILWSQNFTIKQILAGGAAFWGVLDFLAWHHRTFVIDLRVCLLQGGRYGGPFSIASSRS